MHRVFMLLALVGVLTGLLSGRFVHVEHFHGARSTCEAASSLSHRHAEAEVKAGMALGQHDHAGCAEAASGKCHQHSCQHSISPGVSVMQTAFFPASRLLGSAPTVAVPSIDEPVYELDTPPLI